ncbi:hypothetical protein SAMN04488542_12060 [Fontibacillus panacisegetis]|uniref:Uncharacterized protein n=1 Tax=Fontibacillus panacisegetis TaxID=670482 RepID=A0A1G7PZL2_9BACL|nr:hypothetical protein SAMN04488542_12060 [Fontibacillus panacisegetis]
MDEQEYLLIKSQYDALQGKAGALVIKIRLEHLSGVMNASIIQNHRYGSERIGN